MTKTKPRYAIEQVEDDPEYWHVIDTKRDGYIIEICSGRYAAQEIADDLNHGGLDDEED